MTVHALRWQCLIYNGNLETLISSKMWKIYRFAQKVFNSDNISIASYNKKLASTFAKNRKWKSFNSQNIVLIYTWWDKT